MNGTVKARAQEWAFGRTQNGKEYVGVMFEVTAGEHAGKVFSWRGFFTENTLDRTLESLRHCGWDSDSIVELDNLGANEVELVLGEEEYEGKTYTRVQWVNRPSRLAIGEPLAGAELQAFAAKLRGKCIASKQTYKAAPAAKAGGSSNTHRGADGAADFPGSDIPY